MEKKPIKRHVLQVNALILSKLKNVQNSLRNKQGSRPSWDQTIQYLINTSRNEKKNKSMIKSLEREIHKLNWEILMALKLSLARPAQTTQIYSPSFTKIEQNAIQVDINLKKKKLLLQTDLAIEFDKYKIEGQEFILPSDIVKKRELIPPEPPKLNPPPTPPSKEN